jgi:SOS-response transcriptional repressor LexA
MHDYLETLARSNKSYGDGVSIHAGLPTTTPISHRAGVQLSLDLNQHLIKHPSSSFLFQVSGQAGISDGVFDGDIAVIDRALTAQPTDLVIIWQSSGFSLSRQGQLSLDDEPLGVVTAIIHQYRR